jgi:2-alkyl-3-oxoalkanoate reductase
VALPFCDSRYSLDVSEAAIAPVLVTGATGFVGSHVIDAFARTGVPVRALVRRTSATARLRDLGVELVVGSLSDGAVLREAAAGTSAVVHLAALTRARNDGEYHRANVDGTALLAEAAAGTDAEPRRFVYLSSLAAVGPARDGRPVGPDDTPAPLTAYGRSKLAGERICLEARGLDLTILRAPAVYGPRDRDLYRFFRLAARGVLPVPTGPDRPLQLVHVEDLADAVVRATTARNAAGIVHIAEPAAYAWEVVGRHVADAVGRRARVVRVPATLIAAAAACSEFFSLLATDATIFDRDKARELLAPGWLCETDLARERLGFETAIPLPEGLRRTAQWYRNEGWL